MYQLTVKILKNDVICLVLNSKKHLSGHISEYKLQIERTFVTMYYL